jgi:hypothetical protein
MPDVLVSVYKLTVSSAGVVPKKDVEIAGFDMKKLPGRSWRSGILLAIGFNDYKKTRRSLA